MKEIKSDARTFAGEQMADETMARARTLIMEARLAHDALPALTSRREGVLARVELWVKRRARRATHWFTFGQVGFNSSVCTALDGVLSHLARHEQEARRADESLTAAYAELEARITHLERHLTRTVAAETERIGVGLRAEQQARLEQLVGENRVSHKQLRLRLGESEIFADRAHRHTQPRLDELARQVETLRALHDDLRHRHDAPDDEHPGCSGALDSLRSVGETAPAQTARES